MSAQNPLTLTPQSRLVALIVKLRLLREKQRVGEFQTQRKKRNGWHGFV